MYTLAAIKATYRKIVLQSYSLQAPGELLANKLNLNQNSKSTYQEKHVSRKARIKKSAYQEQSGKLKADKTSDKYQSLIKRF